MSTNTKFQKLLPIIAEAGEIILSAHKMECNENQDVSVKAGSANFVTVYDVGVQNFLIQHITEIFPNAVFIAEEKENDPAVLQEEYCFIIDPIDGTTNFIHDYRHSCISVALISRGEVVLGVVYDPYLKDLYYAEKGKGAFVNDRPIHVSNHDMAHALVGFGTSPYDEEMAEKSLQAVLWFLRNAADVRRCGSAALDLAYVAAGRMEVFFEFKLRPWDFAAGALLVTEAGGCFTMPQLEQTDFGQASAVLAATPACMKPAAEWLKPFWG